MSRQIEEFIEQIQKVYDHKYLITNPDTVEYKMINTSPVEMGYNARLELIPPKQAGNSPTTYGTAQCIISGQSIYIIKGSLVDIVHLLSLIE